MRILTLAMPAAVLLFALISVPAPAWAETRDLKAQEANRALVLEFYDQFFNHHQVDKAAELVADDYIQHNPTVPNGKKPFVDYYRDFFKSHPQSKAHIVRSAVNGDLVWLHIHATDNDQAAGEAVVDIFRVKGGKIVEHWDVIQSVPATAANNNTMF